VPDDLKRLFARDGDAHRGLNVGGVAYVQDVHGCLNAAKPSWPAQGRA
jgi:hypothetical protein